MAFQNWVAYGRTSAPDVRAKEHLTCPLLWCRHRFESLASCLQHVSVCPWLSNAYYWCPQCQRAERFTADDLGPRLPPFVTTDRKSSKLKRAVTFFKHFGRRSSIHGQTPESRVSSPKRHTAGNERVPRWCATGKPPSLLNQEAEIPPKSTFSDSRLGSRAGVNIGEFDFGFNAEERRNTLYDMEGNALSPLLSPDTNQSGHDMPELETGDPLFNSTQLGDTSVFQQYAEGHLDEQGRISKSLPSHYGPFSLSLCTSEAQRPWAPSSSIFEPSTAGELETWERPSSVSSIEVYASDLLPTCNLPETDHAVSGEIDEHLEHPASPFEPLSCEAATAATHSSSQVHLNGQLSQSETTESQIRDLRELVCGLHGHWLHEIRSTPGFPYVNSTICGLTPFEAGIRSLQQCFRGSPPCTLEGVLSLMHFAFACAYALHHEPMSHSWHALFSDVLDWRHYLPIKDDRHLYVRIVCLLWAPQDGLLGSKPCTSSQHSEVLAQALNQPRCFADAEMSETNMDEDTETDVNRSQPLQIPFPDTRLAGNKGLHSLSTGAVIKSCSQYLDGEQRSTRVHKALLIMIIPCHSP